MAQPSLGSVDQDYLEPGRIIGSLSESRCGFCHVKQVFYLERCAISA